jgi:hypothetical protein
MARATALCGTGMNWSERRSNLVFMHARMTTSIAEQRCIIVHSFMSPRAGNRQHGALNERERTSDRTRAFGGAIMCTSMILDERDEHAQMSPLGESRR